MSQCRKIRPYDKAKAAKRRKKRPEPFMSGEAFCAGVAGVLIVMYAMTLGAESRAITSGKYNHLRPAVTKPAPPPVAKAENVLPRNYATASAEFNDIFTAYSQNPEAFRIEGRK